MKHLGVREFRDKASHYLKLDCPLAIERHGDVIGYYLPVRRKDPEAIKKRLGTFEQALEQVLAGTELSEEAFAQLVEQAKDEPQVKAGR